MSEKGSKVYFGSVQQGRIAEFASLSAKVDKILELLDLSTIKTGDKVAIKMHLGFNTGYQTIPVFFVRRIVKAVQKTGGYPFITDNPTSVYNAVDRGYTQETCGCPIIPVAGIKDKYTYEAMVNYRGIEKLDMAGVLHDADALIDLSHAKGHGASGYGGAIKNLALGGYSGPTRWTKIHQAPYQVQFWDPKKCTPEHAEEIAKSCKYDAIKYDKKKHHLQIEIHECVQCNECLETDKGVGCLELKQEGFSAFQEMLAIAAKQVVDRFDKSKRFFLNFIIQVTPYCDCMGMGMPCVVPDVGVVGSRDIVAIETATLDLISKAGLLEKAIPPHFMHANLDPGADLHPFQRIHGAMKNPYLATEFAEKLGMGSRRYELVEVLSPEETLKMEPPKRAYERQPTFF
ncbi:MAG: DUF362 domain-containing protein [Promethearchaeati archaeon SRVP18_Atabeyarchaeia-1]